ncbi:MAG: hypothetical protein EXQ57_06060, partial [Bryobacterales bacterium]|nr:hypothetical protein [Bryobacterales bacterium]
MRAISLLVMMGLVAAGQAKRPVTFADYDSWKAITGQTLSADGKWLAYALLPQVGDGEVIARELATGREIRIPAGMQPARPEAEGEEEIGPPPPRGPRIVFSGDGRFVVTQTFAPKGTKTPKGGLAILALATGVVTRIE